jgi:ferritin
MVSERMLKELNQQINEELYSEYIYQAMAADLEDKNLKGMATWMRVQVREEHAHAMIFLNYIIERRCKAELEAIKKPPATWDSALAIFEGAHEHEKHITGRINYMVKVAREENDNATLQMLQWFVEEQVGHPDLRDPNGPLLPGPGTGVSRETPHIFHRFIIHFLSFSLIISLIRVIYVSLVH